MTLALASAALALALAQSAPAPVDLGQVRGQLVFLVDGASHVIALDRAEPTGENLFYSSNGTSFSRVTVIGGGRKGTESFDTILWDPRARLLSGGYATLQMTGSGAEYAMTCARKRTVLKAVAPEEATKRYGAAVFTESIWDRRPVRLLRDESGTYYFVDRFRSREEDDRRDYRVYAGRKGAMSQVPLVDVVDDSEGLIFATKTGQLRLVVSNSKLREAKWVEGKAATTLIDIPLDRVENLRMVYVDLGPYAQRRLGTPCDDLM